MAGLIAIFILISRSLSAQKGITPLYELVLSDTHHVSGIDWKPDGSQIAWAVDKDIRILTSALQPVTLLQGHTDNVLSIDWSSDGTHLASGSADSTLRIWDMTTNPPALERTLFGNTNWVVTVAWSPDSSRLASVSLDNPLPNHDGPQSYTTWIWDAFSGAKLKTLPKQVYAYALAWNPKMSDVMARGWTFDKVDVVDLASDTIIRDYFIQTGMTVNSLDWDSTGRLLLVGFEGNTLPVADTAVNTLDYQIFLDLPLGAATVDWRGDDTYIAAGTSKGADILIWDSETAQQVLTIPQAHAGPPSEPDLYSDPIPEAERVAEPDGIFEIEWSPDGTILASVSQLDNTLRLWDTSNLPDLEGTATATAPYPTPTP